MKINRLIIAEIVIIVGVLSSSIYLISVNPFLEASKVTTLSLFNEIKFPQEEINLGRGNVYYVRFNYNSYEPVILVIDINYKTWVNSGTLMIYCNGRFVAGIQASPETGHTSLNVISFSGVDWVKPMSNNVVSFISGTINGYEGSFAYQLKLRGSR